MAVIWGDAPTGPDGSGGALAGRVPRTHRVARAALIGAAAVYAVELEASIALPGGSPPGFEFLGLGVMVCLAAALSLPALAASRMGGAVAVWLLAVPATVAAVTLLRSYLHVLASVPIESPAFPVAALSDTGVGAAVFGLAALLAQPPLGGRQRTAVAVGCLAATSTAWILVARL